MGDNGFSIYTNSMNILKIFLDLDFFFSVLLLGQLMVLNLKGFLYFII